MKQKTLVYIMLSIIAILFAMLISLIIYEFAEMILDNKCTVTSDMQYFVDHDCERFEREMIK